MPKEHRCKKNDHICKISNDYKFFDWKSIWNDSFNNQLRKRRKNPNVLFTGDRSYAGKLGDAVQIPDKKEKKIGKSIDAEHKFEIQSQEKLWLRLRILNLDFTPLKDSNYELIVDGIKEPFKGKTDDKGEIVIAKLPPTIQKATLSLRAPADQAAKNGPSQKKKEKDGGEKEKDKAVKGDPPVSWELKIGRLNPIMEKAPSKRCYSGVQQRLNNLNINSGPVDGIYGDCTKNAVKMFQSMFNLAVDGIPGQGETQPELEKIHDKNTYLGEPPPEGATDISLKPSKESLRVKPEDIGHIAADFEDGTFFNTLVIRPEYRISIRLGDFEDMFENAPNTKKGRMERLQVLGLFYFPLKHNRAEAIFDHANGGWNYFKSKFVNSNSDDDADAKIQELLKEWIVPGEALPPMAKDPEKPGDKNFKKLRLPGGYTFTDTYINNVETDNEHKPRYQARWVDKMYDLETRFYEDNPALRKIPVVATVEKRDMDTGEWNVAPDADVYFQLVPPYKLPEFKAGKSVTQQLNRPPLRATTIGGEGGTDPADAALGAGEGAGPKGTDDEKMQANGGFPTGLPEKDPQRGNCPEKWGGSAEPNGKNSDDGSAVADIIFSATSKDGFNTATDRTQHKPYPLAEKVAASGDDHRHAVKAKTNEEGEAGVIFMPSRCGGDSYRLRAYVGPDTVKGPTGNGSSIGSFSVDTGTFVTWRHVRISRYLKQGAGSVAQALLDDWNAHYVNKTDDSYRAMVRVTRQRADGTYEEVGMPQADLGNNRHVDVGGVGSDFDNFKSQFAKAFVEVELDPGISGTGDNLTAAEWSTARGGARDAAVAAQATLGTTFDIPTLMYLEASPPAISVGNACALIPMRLPAPYNAAVPAANRMNAPGTSNTQANLGTLTWAALMGFMKSLSYAGSLPGLTLLTGANIHTLQFAGIASSGGVAIQYRGSYCILGSDFYPDKVAKYNAAARKQSYGFEGLVAHELGHCLFRSHAKGKNGTSGEGGAAMADRHDNLNRTICVMAYKSSEAQFCANCLFGMRGMKIPLA